jgi:dTDP-4-dehydrorhamnose reductase
VAIDLRDSAAVERLFAEIRPDAVVHTAVSNQPASAVPGIAVAAESVVRASGAFGARLVHVSTDVVFSGTTAPYLDDAPADPITPYGEAKAEAERRVAGMDPGAVIVRPSLVFGVDPLDRQTGWLVDDMRAGKPVRLFTDEIRCPIWVDNLAAALLELAASDVAGPLNLGGAQAVSRWDFGLRLLDLLDEPRRPNLQPSTLAEGGLVRPADLTMDVSRAKRLLGTPILTVDEAIGRMRRQRAGSGATE